MLWDWIKLLVRGLRTGSANSRQAKRTVLTLERLEDRTVPVVGATVYSDAPLTPRGAGYDGIIDYDSNNATGSLLFTGRHILTAAHVIAGSNGKVKFELKRDGANVDITIPVPANDATNTYRVTHPAWDGNVLHGKDIAIIRLTDPVNPSQTRFIVAPFGAERYTLYDGTDEVGKRFTFVGYGYPGKGATGEDTTVNPTPKRSGQNRFDLNGTSEIHEIQAINLSAIPTQGGFKLSHSGAITDTIAFDASPAAIQAALETAKTGANATPLLNKVVVRGKIDDGGARYYFVEFTDKLGPVGDPWNAANITVPVNTMKDAGMAAVGVTITERNRGGVSTFGDKALIFDFDSRRPENDAIGLFYGIPDPVGLAGEEAISARGDSGGPSFLKGSTAIAAVTSSRGWPGLPNQIPDVDGNPLNSTFGEIARFTRVSSYTKRDAATNRDNFLNETIDPSLVPSAAAAAGRYDIVLDMNYQILGNSNPGEDVKAIIAKQVANQLQLWVDVDGDGAFNGSLEGLYFSEDVSKIKTLTLRGSGDNETFIIDGPLGLGGEDGKGKNAKIELVGREGNDKFVIGSSALGATGLNDFKEKIYVDGGPDNAQPRDWLYIDDKSSDLGRDYRFSPDTSGWGGDGKIERFNLRVPGADVMIFYKATEAVTLWTGSKNDTVAIDATNKLVWNSGYYINTSAGKDTITIGTEANGLNKLADVWSRIFVDGGPNEDELVVDDQAFGAQHKYDLGPDTTGWGGDGQIKRNDKPEIVHFAVEKVTLKTGTAVDTITVTATHESVTKGTFIESGGGGDIITVGDKNGPGLDNIKTFVEIDTQDKINKSTLTIDDKGSTANHIYVLDQKNSLTRDNNKLIRFKNVLVTKAALLLPADKRDTKNELKVVRWLSGSSLDVSGGASQDIITISSKANTLDNIQGILTVSGGDDRDQLLIGDSGYVDGDTYTITKNSFRVARLPNLTLNFAGLEDLNLYTGSGPDIVNLDGLAASVHLNLDTAVSYDKVKMISGEVYDPDIVNIEALNILGGTLTLHKPLDIEDLDQSGGTLDGLGTLTATSSVSWFGGTMSGSGQTIAASSATLNISGAVNLEERTFRNEGIGTWSGYISGGTGIVENFGTFSGTGTLEGDLANYGILYPGGALVPGAITVMGNFTHDGGSLEFDLGDGGSDSISVSGTVTLGGSLNLTALGELAGNSYTIINNTGSNAIAGIFADYPEGALVPVGNRDFPITYLGGAGDNDVVLTGYAPMTITMAWSPSGDPYACDFDSGVTVFGTRAGWHGDANTVYVIWHGDVTSCGAGAEVTTVNLYQAREANLWSDSVTISLTGAWWSYRPYQDLQTDFTIDVTVAWNGVTRNLWGVSAGSEPDFPSGAIGTIIAYDDGTYYLSSALGGSSTGYTLGGLSSAGLNLPDNRALDGSMLAPNTRSTSSSSGESEDQSIQAAWLDKSSSPLAWRVGETEPPARHRRWQAAVDAVFSRLGDEDTGNRHDALWQAGVQKESETEFDFLWDMPVEVLQKWFPRR